MRTEITRVTTTITSRNPILMPLPFHVNKFQKRNYDPLVSANVLEFPFLPSGP